MGRIKSLVKLLPGIRGVIADRNQLREELRVWQRFQAFPPGHFYSPIPGVDSVDRLTDKLNENGQCHVPDEIPGVNLRWEEQEKLVGQLSRFYSDLPFAASEDGENGCRYYYENGYFSYSDGIALYGILRHFEPRRLIEVGSGFSSALVLDTNERFLEGQLDCTFIEPFPDRLRNRLKPSDEQRVRIVEQPVQDVPLETFSALETNDILFIDSSHVGKTQSDVNYLIFDVLPALRSGVLIHFHDVFYPFEYPFEWIQVGRAWNEAYLVRALLMFTDAFQIRLWGHAMSLTRPNLLRESMPLCERNSGASLWLQKTDWS